MEIREVKCDTCGKEIYVKEGYLREKMFCTLGCMVSHADASMKQISFH